MQSSQTILVHDASQGVGYAIAACLAQRGHQVFAAGRDGRALAQLRRDADGAPLETLRLNAGSVESIAWAKQRVRRRTRGAGIDVLVNACADKTRGRTERLRAGNPAAVAADALAMMDLAFAFLPFMRTRGSGRIINVAALTPGGGHDGRRASPVGPSSVEEWNRVLRGELTPFGIDVVFVEPAVTVDPEPPRPEALAARGARPVRGNETRTWRRWITQYQGLELIARTIARIVAIRKPAARYVVGPFGPTLSAGLALLPARLTSELSRRASALLAASRPERAIRFRRQRWTASLSEPHRATWLAGSGEFNAGRQPEA